MAEVRIESSDGKSIALAGELTEYRYPIRLRRALMSFGIGLLLALGSLPIPGLHFFLVPSFLIFAFYSGVSRFNEAYSMDLSRSKCPNCLSPLSEKKIHLKSFPIRIHCFECRTQLRIVE